MLNYKLIAFFLGLWAVAAIVTGAVERTEIVNVAGSTQDVNSLGNNVFEGEEVSLDQPVTVGTNPISAAWSIANAATGQLTFMFRAASLNSPIWEGWAQPVRWVILILQGPFLILVLLRGAEILSGFIPFT